MLEKILIIGANGSLGKRLLQDFSKEFRVTGTYNTNYIEGLIHLDITKKEEVKKVLKKENPDIAIIASAMTNVEDCELNPKQAEEINIKGVNNIISFCNKRKVVFFSTDAVFDGMKKEYFEEDKPHPINVYGKTKLIGERIVKTNEDYLICRPSRLYGVGSSKFINKIIDSLSKEKHFEIPIESKGNPTFIPSVSRATLNLIKKNKKGIYHVVNPEIYSLDEVVYKIVEIFDFDKSLIIPVEKDFFNKNVKRPSVILNTNKLKKENIYMETLEEGLQKLKNTFK